MGGGRISVIVSMHEDGSEWSRVHVWTLQMSSGRRAFVTAAGSESWELRERRTLLAENWT